MLGTIKEKISNNAKNRMYDKENKEVLVEFRDTIIKDIEVVYNDALAVKMQVDKVTEGNVYSDEFVMGKVESEIKYLNSCIETLEQMKNKSPKLFRLMDIYRAYKRIIKTYRSIRHLREYVYRIKEDRVVHEFKENSQYS